MFVGDLTATRRFPAGAPGPVVITDGLRRREVAFGRAHDNVSATMTAAEEFDRSQTPQPTTTCRRGATRWRPPRPADLGITGVAASQFVGAARLPMGGARTEYRAVRGGRRAT